MQEPEAIDLVKDYSMLAVNICMLIGLLLITVASILFGVNKISFALISIALFIKLLEDIRDGKNKAKW